MPEAASKKTGPTQGGGDGTADIQRLLADRFSCRAYTGEQVPRETIEKIISASQRTPSWCNSQPWQVIVTSGEETEKFRKVMFDAAGDNPPASPDFPFPREYHGVYQDRRRESGFQLYNALGIARGDKDAYNRQTRENFRFFGAPHIAIITSDEALGVYGAVDCGAFVSTFVLVALSHGVATIPQAAVARQSPIIRKHFGIPEDRRIVCGISFGYADMNHPANKFRTNRAELPAVATWVG